MKGRSKDGGPAFPVMWDEAGEHVAVSGMTLRQWYAGMALCGLMNTPGVLGINQLTVVESCFSMSDEMIKYDDK